MAFRLYLLRRSQLYRIAGVYTNQHLMEVDGMPLDDNFYFSTNKWWTPLRFHKLYKKIPGVVISTSIPLYLLSLELNMEVEPLCL